jgi:hypothetical protein
VARGFRLQVGGPAHTLRVISNRDILDLDVVAQKEETITVPAGQIACFRIGITTKPVNAHAKESDDFETPFGLHGKVELYVDKETMQLVLVRGKVAIAADFDVEVALTSRSVERLPNAGATSR